MQKFDPKTYNYAPGILQDRVILITGASDGIGRALALLSAKLGARLVIHGRDWTKLETVRKEIASIPGAEDPLVSVIDLDGDDEERFAALRHDIESRYGRLDGLVHNAGILGDKAAIEDYDPEQWERVLRINLTAPFTFTRHLLPLIKLSDDPSVVFTTSGLGRNGRALGGAYSVSKFGIEALAQILAREHDNARARFNSVDPGPVRSKMSRAAHPHRDQNSMKKPEDILATFVYLLGPDSKGVSGKRFRCQKKASSPRKWPLQIARSLRRLVSEGVA